MNDTRERLVELLWQWGVQQYIPFHTEIAMLADHLIANGAIFPPCKVGDTVYRLVACPPRVSKYTWEIVEIKIFADEIHLVDDSDNVFSADEIGKTVFPTKEEAERALKERERNGC